MHIQDMMHINIMPQMYLPGHEVIHDIALCRIKAKTSLENSKHTINYFDRNISF